MIRAIYHNGAIQPLDELPVTWRDGQELVVDAIESEDTAETFDEWVAEIRDATVNISEDDHQRMEEFLKRYEAESKELGRREMERAPSIFADESNDHPTKHAG
jgi:predicted DNA-binding antitoxin AbrB/MazE fold protein